ncbi:interleukin-12 receptor subunit beta-1 [Thalassophryne amazonica]|uniref:interleukin-12 receptor subunit beta-1 n=1 Tax=Thalassophryne amazonica TaxID=390379 RepID=UPI0014708992|nr:interleukin-12 receptor subunit beta-1 [Thalassophryne amazonica]
MGCLKGWCSLHGYITLFTLIITAKKQSACEGPSTPQCFRRSLAEENYMCEWTMNTTDSNVTYKIFYDGKNFGILNETWIVFNGEVRVKQRAVRIWVEAHTGNSSCRSPTNSVTLKQTVKYERPQNISVSWLENSLILRWRAPETYPALADVLFRRETHSTGSWENGLMTNTTIETSMYQIILLNLHKHSAYLLQVRQRSNEAKNPLWSDWSPVIIVPAELENMTKVSTAEELMNGTRKLTLTWEPMPHAAAVGGLTYRLTDMQSSQRCPCRKNKDIITTKTKHTLSVLYSPVTVSVIAVNAAGKSSPAVLQLPAATTSDLKSCDKTLIKGKLVTESCGEWYELPDGESMSETVFMVTKANKKQNKTKTIRQNMKDYVRYLYFEHRCVSGTPQTVKICLFYKTVGAPRSKPQEFGTTSETHNSAHLSWKAIPSVDLQGFLTHYSLCSVKVNLQDKVKDCLNISASLTKHHLEKLTPATKYNISLAGVTRAGEGPAATVIIDTLPENSENDSLWLSIGLLFVLFFISIMCTFILKRMKSKLFPPVPIPVIRNVAYQPENQEMLERKEEVHEVMLYQLKSEEKTVILGDTEETAVLQAGWDKTADSNLENEGIVGDAEMSDEMGHERLTLDSEDQESRATRNVETTNVGQADAELAMLIYRNGLVFDMKTDFT